MDMTTIIPQLFELVIFPLLGIATLFLVAFIGVKIQKMKRETNDDLAIKYWDMLNETITNCVLATTQTYVDTLKKQGKFDEEAQKIAFETTYQNVMSILTDEAKKYLITMVGDLEACVQNKIEAEVFLNK